MDLYSYLPDLSSEWGEPYDVRPEVRLEDWDAYWERTHPDEPPPDWIDGLNKAYVNFVIHLTAIDSPAFDALAPTVSESQQEWEFRKPEQCPAGLLSEGNFIQSD